MKTLSNGLLLALMLTAGFSCKKSNDATPKDYNAAIKEKNWWGSLSYTGKTPEYYCVSFKADNSLTWVQRTGSTQGLWALDGNRLTITFVGNTLQIKATVADDNSLTAIEDNTSASEILSGQQINTPPIYLDDTNWKGSIPASAQVFKLSFSAPQKLIADAGAPFGPLNYERLAGGAAIKFNSGAFGGDVLGVIVSATEIKGTMSIGGKNYLWSTIRQ